MRESRKVRVTVMALNMLTATPMNRVSAKPITAELATMLLPNQYRMPQAMKVVTLLSLMAGHARLNPVSMAALGVRPARSSSFIRSKMSTLASTAIPREMMKPATPARLIVTGIIL